jgi:alkanesulfonate monooxygenase SsuD/methylene tetrahydromethanopterin reductase-like flavin-dependent oxidoreductase (luciferase family)
MACFDYGAAAELFPGRHKTRMIGAVTYKRFAAAGEAIRYAVEVLPGLLAGKTVTYRGRMFAADQVHLGFELRRKQVPVYVAAMADRALKICGEVGDGLIIGNMCPPAYGPRRTCLRSASTRSSPLSAARTTSFRRLCTSRVLRRSHEP